MIGEANILLFRNAHIISPMLFENLGWLLVENSRISRIGSGQPPSFAQGFIQKEIDAKGLSLLPGLIDIHVHGAMGAEAMDANPDGLKDMAKFFAGHGVTSFLAATWAAPSSEILHALTVIAANEGAIEGGANLLGAYLEGPYLNPLRAGAQSKESIRKANPDEYLGFLGNGSIKIAVVAPEFFENNSFIDECLARKIVLSAGHCEPDYGQMLTAIQRGFRLVTHTFNGMAPLDHRNPGILGAVMLASEISCELIADNIHVHPAVMKILHRLKGSHRIILMTDAVRPTGMREGKYKLGGKSVTYQSGEIRLKDGTLAGSALTLEKGLRNFIQATGCKLDEAWQCASLNPAQLLRIEDKKGSIEIGKDADLILVDEKWDVRLTMVGGNVVFSENMA